MFSTAMDQPGAETRVRCVVGKLQITLTRKQIKVATSWYACIALIRDSRVGALRAIVWGMHEHVMSHAAAPTDEHEEGGKREGRPKEKDKGNLIKKFL